MFFVVAVVVARDRRVLQLQELAVAPVDIWLEILQYQLVNLLVYSLVLAVLAGMLGRRVTMEVALYLHMMGNHILLAEVGVGKLVLPVQEAVPVRIQVP